MVKSSVVAWIARSARRATKQMRALALSSSKITPNIVVTAVLVAGVGAVGSLTPVAIHLWFSLFTDVDNPYLFPNFFILAQVVAIFSGFGLVAGFSQNIKPSLRRDLRLMSTLYLLSALSFTLHGLILPAVVSTEYEGFSEMAILRIAAFSFVTGVAAFTAGTLFWAIRLPAILDLGSSDS